MQKIAKIVQQHLTYIHIYNKANKKGEKDSKTLK